MKFTVMGSGASGGTPMAGGFWGRCDPNEPRNERTRASLLVETDEATIVIDTSYDLRQQLNKYKIQKIDAVFLTHQHADHTNGIDDLKAVAYHHARKIPVYANDYTASDIERRWSYLFEESSAGGIYKGFLEKNIVTPYVPFSVGDIDVLPFEQDHRTCMSLGFRFGDFAYSVDVFNLDEKALQALEGVDTWVVDAGGYMKEPIAHANIQNIISWTERLKPRVTYITALSTHMDYKTLCEELPPHIRPAYDGLEINL